MSLSLRLDIGRPDYSRPLLGVIGDEFPEFGRRTCKRRVAQIGEARLDPSLGKTGVDLFVEPVDDLGWSALGCRDPCQPLAS